MTEERTENLPAWVASARSPLPGDSPGGEYLRWDEDYDAIREEINSYNSPLRDAGPNWKFVVDRGIRLLCERSKDLHVAVYLTVALFETRGYVGLVEGLEVIAEYVDALWDVIFPPKRRLRARVGVLSWLYDWLESAVERVPPGVDDYPHARQSVALLDRCADAARRRIEDSPPTGAHVRRMLRDHLQVLEAKVAEQRVEEAARARVSGEQEAPPEPGGAPEDPGASDGRGGEGGGRAVQVEARRGREGGAEQGTAQVSVSDIESESGTAAPRRTGAVSVGEAPEAEVPEPRVALEPGPETVRDVGAAPAVRSGVEAREADPSPAVRSGARPAASGSGVGGDAGPVAGGAGAPSAPLSLGAETQKQLKQLVKQARPIVASVRQASPASPASYQLARAVVWALFDGVPPAEGGRTKIPGPAKREISHFERAYDAGDFAALVESAESRFFTLPLWLDLQWWTWRALEARGGAYHAAAEAVASLAVSFVGRLPGVEDLSFKDGTPFLASQARQWLEGEAARKRPSAASPLPRASVVEAGEAAAGGWDAVVAEARRQVEASSPEGALMWLQDQANRLPTGKARFRARLDLANLALELGWADEAALLLEHLERVARRHELEAWDEPLAGELLAARIRAVAAVGAGRGDDAGEMRRLLGRLCAVDIGMAVTIKNV